MTKESQPMETSLIKSAPIVKDQNALVDCVAGILKGRAFRHRKAWFYYPNGELETGLWLEDSEGAQVISNIKRIAQALYLTGHRTREEDFLASCQRTRAVEDIARGVGRELIGDAARLDADRMLLSVANGVLDLRTLRRKNGRIAVDLRPPSPDNMVSKVCGCGYDPDAVSNEKWLGEFLPSTFVTRKGATDPDLVDYMQRFAGMCLTGDMREELFLFLYGRGSNGKSTFLNVLGSILGDYATLTDPEALVMEGKTSGPNNYMARLRGARLAWCNEVPGKKGWSEKIKTLTDEMITAHSKFGPVIDFLATHKMIFAGNELPSTSDLSYGFERRVRIVPYFAKFVREEDAEGQAKEKIDKLKNKILETEEMKSAVLNWLLEGCLLWQESGLGVCEAIDRETREYLDEQRVGTVEDFIECNCTVDDDAKVYHRDLFEAYRACAEANNYEALGGRVFTSELKKLGYRSSRAADPLNKRLKIPQFSGLSLGCAPDFIVVPTLPVVSPARKSA
jgi:putative DNA primase/helicase